MTPEPHTDRPDAAPLSRARLALAMDMEGLALMERTPVGWVRRAELSLNAEDFAARMGALRDEALALGAAGGVELWLPAEQILPLRVAPDGPGPGPFRRALAEATPHPLDELTWDLVPVEGGFAVAAAWRKTVQEARDFAAKWDLPVARVTTRAADADFPEGPSFSTVPADPPAPPKTLRKRPPLALLSGGAALAAAAIGLWIWLTSAPDLPNPSAVWAPPTALSALTPEETAAKPPAPTAPAAVAPVPEGPEAAAPLLERPPASEAPAEAPQASQAAPLGGGTDTDRAPRPAARDAEPGHSDAPAASVAPPPDRSARPVIEPEGPENREAPPAVALLRPLAAPPKPGLEAVAPPAPVAPPAVQTSVSVLDEEPKGLADRTPPPEVMGTEFDPLEAPTDPEEQADAEEESHSPDAAPEPAEVSKAPEASEIPEEYLAGPDTPRPSAKPGEATETAGAAPDAAAEAGADDSADGASTHALAEAPRPLPKPVSAKDLAEAEDLAPTRLAALAAPRPVGKPAGLKRRAGALATARAKARDEARRAAASGDRTEKRRSAQIPSSASLAAAATTRNAVELSETILVGVFGAPSSRRAILRLPNGDVRRVKRGESVDGWTVANIGQSSIRLTKSGKSQTLNIPGE